jgi:hypothetical protein
MTNEYLNATNMPKRKKRSRGEIARKLAQANRLARQGKLQREIARTLGVSVIDLAPVAQGSACTQGGPNCSTPPRKFTVAATGKRSASS